MMTRYMDGDGLSGRVLASVKERLSALQSTPVLAVIKVEGDPASDAFVNIKQQRCREVGIECRVFSFAQDATQAEIIRCIEELNQDRAITGVLVQLPLPDSYDSRALLDTINPNKDVEGLTRWHLGSLLCGEEQVLPCTPRGVLTLLEHYEVALESRHVCLVGYSDIIGKPLGALCLNRNATVTVCHRYTANLASHTAQADIVITAAGIPGLVHGGMVRRGSVLIDVGFARVERRVTGDVDVGSVDGHCSLISPVPGGVGPMTVASLLQNLLDFAVNNPAEVW